MNGLTPDKNNNKRPHELERVAPCFFVSVLVPASFEKIFTKNSSFFLLPKRLKFPLRQERTSSFSLNYDEQFNWRVEELLAKLSNEQQLEEFKKYRERYRTKKQCKALFYSAILICEIHIFFKQRACLITRSDSWLCFSFFFKYKKKQKLF